MTSLLQQAAETHRDWHHGVDTKRHTSCKQQFVTLNTKRHKLAVGADNVVVPQR